VSTFAIVFAAMAALYVFDAFLERMEVAESQAEAQRLYQRGQMMLQQRDYNGAIEQFRAALSFSRQNPDYQLALARSFMGEGKYADAETTVRGLLDQDPSNGASNLTMARILVKENRIGDASFYYHRAIYGKWPDNAAAERLQVRLELIDLLARQGDKQELLAELLPLQDENLDLATRTRIANLYLAAGSPGRASDMFREILHEQPTNAAALQGLGAAEFAKGNYRVARSYFLNASRLQPANPAIRKQLDLAGKVLALDPMLRGLSSHERYERSTRLLQMASQSVATCIGPAVPSDAQPLLDSAAQALSRRVRPNQENDATNANLDLAEKLYQARRKDCKQPLGDDEEAMALVLAKTQ
jgi:tetratricopeptide (TPR) repeat protein